MSVSPFLYLSIAVVVRSLSARLSVVDDCDEVFNYWEPVHLLLYGTGMQTWEYAPQFGLRSYWYPGFMAGVARAALRVVCGAGNTDCVPRFSVWFGLRGFLGLFCALCEAFLYASLRRYVASSKGWVGGAGDVLCNVFAVSMLSCAGMFAASTALLPNSLSMCIYMVAFGFWLRGKNGLAVAVAATGALLGVPFSALLLAPMALHILWMSGFKSTFSWAVLGSVLSIGPQLVIDRVLYRRWVVAIANIVYYNALSSETDSTLYGVEPWTFYAKNLLLNLNVLAVLAPMAVPLLLLHRQRSLLALVCSSSLVWLAFMFSLPHKEQRFLYPVYPIIILSGASVIAVIYGWIVNLFGKISLLKNAARILLMLSVTFVLLAGALRVAAQTQQRAGPLRVWHSVQNVRNSTICMGDDWFRFPSSFWLPDESVRLRFVQSGFHGLLPKAFAPWPEATFVEPTGMNGGNKEVVDDRFVALAECDFIVKELSSDDSRSKVVRSDPLIDDQASSALFRAFYVPRAIRPPNAVVWKQYAVIDLSGKFRF